MNWLLSDAEVEMEIDRLSADRSELVREAETFLMFGKVRECEDVESRIREIGRKITDLLDESLERSLKREQS